MKNLKRKITEYIDLLIGVFFLSNKKSAKILMYHSVGNNQAFFSVTPKDFAEQMEYLFENKFNVISLEKLVSLCKTGGEIPEKIIVITFDDGYLDNYLKAYPVLEKYNFPVTIFLAVGSIGGARTNRAGEKMGMLDWSRIKSLHASGLIDFEPHTVNHPKLSKISREEAEREILDSKNILEKELNKECRFFAYPYGDYRGGIGEFIAKHFDAAVTVERGVVCLGDNFTRLKRNSIDAGVNFKVFKMIVE